MKFENIVEAIGRTPLVRLNQIVPQGSATVYAKLESFNPCSSVKDRIAAAMISAAEADGSLKPGMTIVEPTSGNTGIALAMVAATKGYRCVFTMPESMSLERRALLSFFGSELILTPKELGMKGAIEKADELSEDDNTFQPRQFSNKANPEIHFLTTGREIIEDLGDLKLDALVAGVGTGGTISGVGKAVKERYGSRVFAVEPEDSAILSGGEPGPHPIQGIGAGFIPDNYDASVVDEIIAISADEAFEIARKLARFEGILAGTSSGAIVAAALKVAKRLGEGKTVVTFVCDTGERYISTALYEQQVNETTQVRVAK